MRYNKNLKPALEHIDTILLKARKARNQHEKEQLMATAQIMIDELNEDKRVTV